jgi:hypothetical protein
MSNSERRKLRFQLTPAVLHLPTVISVSHYVGKILQTWRPEPVNPVHHQADSLNPLKTKLVSIIFKNLVRTSKRTPHFTITKINWLMLFKEIIAVYSENHKKPINTK